MTSNSVSRKPSITVLGYFDGVHLGHSALFKAAKQLKNECGLKITACSFDVLPYKKIITPAELRSGWLHELGADDIVYLSFDKVKDFSAEQFVSKILKDQLSSSAAVCGYNYHFGKGGSADAGKLAALCQQYSILPVTVAEFKSSCSENSGTVCSTYIRSLICKGNLELAFSLMGHHFATCGTVVHGRQFGRSAGFPTLNQIPDGRYALPPNGVYATYCKICGKYFPSVTNIGSRPTFFEGNSKNIETHIIGFSGDLYDKNIPVGYLSKIRNEIKFNSSEELVKQIQSDSEASLSIFNANKSKLLLPTL